VCQHRAVLVCVCVKISGGLPGKKNALASKMCLSYVLMFLLSKFYRFAVHHESIRDVLKGMPQNDESIRDVLKGMRFIKTREHTRCFEGHAIY